MAHQPVTTVSAAAALVMESVNRMRSTPAAGWSAAVAPVARHARHIPVEQLAAVAREIGAGCTAAPLILARGGEPDCPEDDPAAARWRQECGPDSFPRFLGRVARRHPRSLPKVLLRHVLPTSSAARHWATVRGLEYTGRWGVMRHRLGLLSEGRSAGLPGRPAGRASSAPGAVTEASAPHEGPTVSVLMGVYNCADTLAVAVGSILGQTGVDWELIMCDDGSSDATLTLAQALAQGHDNITVLRNPVNRGLAPTLNVCAAAARGRYLARMDGDDVCAPDRLRRQVDFLEATPEVAFVGTGVQFFDDGVWSVLQTPERPDEITLSRGNPFVHGSIVLRREALEAVGGYSEDDRHWRVEDYDLWVRLYAAGFRGAALPEPLYGLRNDSDAMARRSWRARMNETLAILGANRALGLPAWRSLAAVRPIVLGLLPLRAYSHLYRRRYDRQSVRSDVGWATPSGWSSGADPSGTDG
jgi:glycosyltransferase EpsE